MSHLDQADPFTGLPRYGELQQQNLKEQVDSERNL